VVLVAAFGAAGESPVALRFVEADGAEPHLGGVLLALAAPDDEGIDELGERVGSAATQVHDGHRPLTQGTLIRLQNYGAMSPYARS
jgi:hypothetical protein